VDLLLTAPNGTAVAGSPFSMTSDGTTHWISGVVFSKQLTLSAAGTYKYSFTASDGPNKIAWPASKKSGPIVGAASPAPALAVGGVVAEQVAQGVALTYSLSAPAEVQAVIYNLAGRIIATVPEQRQDQGVQSLRWNGRNTTGSLAPAGVYLVQVRACAEDGSVAQSVTSLVLRR
jgi:hypothetical protein